MRPPVIFNRLGSDTQILKSVIGLNLDKTGSPTYAACRFGSGVKCTNGSYPFIDMGSYFNHPAFTFTFFVKYDSYSMTNATPSDSLYHDVFFYRSQALFNYPQMGIIHRGPDSVTQVFLFLDDFNYCVINVTTGLDVALNDVVYYAFIYNSAESNPNRLKLYYKNLTSGQTTTFTETDSLGSLGNFVSNADDLLGVGQQFLANRGLDAIIDNFKLYDYAITRYTDQYSERGGLNDQVIITS